MCPETSSRHVEDLPKDVVEDAFRWSKRVDYRKYQLEPLTDPKMYQTVIGQGADGLHAFQIYDIKDGGEVWLIDANGQRCKAKIDQLQSITFLDLD